MVVSGINLDELPALYHSLVVHFAPMSHLDEVAQQFVGLSVGLLHLLELVSQSHTVGLQRAAVEEKATLDQKISTLSSAPGERKSKLSCN